MIVCCMHNPNKKMNSKIRIVKLIRLAKNPTRPNLNGSGLDFYNPTQGEFGSGMSISNTRAEHEPNPIISIVELLKCPNYI